MLGNRGAGFRVGCAWAGQGNAAIIAARTGTTRDFNRYFLFINKAFAHKPAISSALCQPLANLRNRSAGFQPGAMKETLSQPKRPKKPIKTASPRLRDERPALAARAAANPTKNRINRIENRINRCVDPFPTKKPTHNGIAAPRAPAVASLAKAGQRAGFSILIMRFFIKNYAALSGVKRFYGLF
jgi:hypothetical protein